VVAPPPASRSGIVTFGSLNNFSKVSPAVIDLWTRILRETAARGIHSRLLLHASEGAHRQRVLDQLSPFGIAPDRVEFVGWLPRNQYFALYARIDVALDPFPYCGGTTTCDALWMGVPVVTLRAPPHMPAVGRGGASILSQVGLSELVSDNVDQYLRLAVDLAADLPRLTNLRRDMRARMTASPLLDVPGFVRDLEAAYRGMWERP
jgi:protein O-GlcNAc transferase